MGKKNEKKQEKNINNLKDIVPKNNSVKYCNFDEFLHACEMSSEKSNNLSKLYETISMSDKNESFDPNRLNNYINKCKRNLKVTINNLTTKDWETLRDLINTDDKSLSVNINYIINEYGRRLKRVILKDIKKEHSNNTIPINVSRDKKRNYINDKKVLTLDDLKNRYIVTIRGMSVISYIDYNFGTNILNRFFDELKSISKDNTSQYIDKTNKLIDETLFYSYFNDKGAVINGVKNYFSLEFSPIKKDDEILNELIADELRYYQQRELEDLINEMDTTYLGTSKRISKEILGENEERKTVIFEELHTSTLPHYAFMQSAFDDIFIIKSSHKDNLPDDYVSKHLTGATFLAYPPKVTFYKDGDRSFIAYSVPTNKYTI